MPLRTGFDALTTGTEIVGFLIAAAGHLMAVGVASKKPPRPVVLINASLSGFFGLGGLIWLLEYSSFTVSISLALFASGLAGFAWGPVGMLLLARGLGKVISKQLDIEVPEPTFGESSLTPRGPPDPPPQEVP